MTAEYKINVEIIHQLFKACVNIILYIRVSSMLRYSLSRFMVRYHYPVILSAVFGRRCAESLSEVFDYAARFIFCICTHYHRWVVLTVKVIVAARIRACIQCHEKDVIIKIVIISFCFHLTAFRIIILAVPVR